jgi:hypothetical protein
MKKVSKWHSRRECFNAVPDEKQGDLKRRRQNSIAATGNYTVCGTAYLCRKAKHGKMEHEERSGVPSGIFPFPGTGCSLLRESPVPFPGNSLFPSLGIACSLRREQPVPKITVSVRAQWKRNGGYGYISNDRITPQA